MHTAAVPAEQANSPTPLKFERFSELDRRGISYSLVHLRRLWESDRFPKPIKLAEGGRLVWLSSELDAWMLERAAARGGDQ